MKTTTKILKAIFRLMAMSQAQALPTLPGIAGQAKRFSASPADAYLFGFYVDWMCEVGD
jgi:hypothetical protein